MTKIAAGGAPGFDYSGMMLIFSQQSLRLNTIILEECVLTDIRTAAAAALGSKSLLGERCAEVTKIGMIGAGVQVSNILIQFIFIKSYRLGGNFDF